MPESHPLEGISIRLLIVDDPALAEAAQRLRGEWHAETDSDFTVANATEKDLAAAKSLPGDGLVVPSAMLGTLAARGLVAPLPEKRLRADGDQWGRIFELLQLHEAAWGNQIMAVPLGSPVLTCYYRADLLEKLNRQPPQTWEEYQDLAQRLGARKPAAGDGPWHGAIEPLGPGLGRPDAAGLGRPLCQTSRQLFRAVRHRDDGTAADRVALRPAPWTSW